MGNNHRMQPALKQWRKLPSRPGQPAQRRPVGPDRAFYVGSMDRSPEPQGALYRVDPSGTVTELTRGFSTSNGLAWTQDGRTMFHTDSQGDMFLDRWDFDSTTGQIANRRRLREHDLANGRADGGAFDQEDIYWSAAPSCSRLNKNRP